MRSEHKRATKMESCRLFHGIILGLMHWIAELQENKGQQYAINQQLSSTKQKAVRFTNRPRLFLWRFYNLCIRIFHQITRHIPNRGV